MKVLKNKVFLGYLIILAIIFTLSCISKIEPTPVIREIKPEAIEKAAWQQEWDNTMVEAKKEGKLVIYLTDAAAVARNPLIKAMKDTFGIETEIVVARSAELITKLFNERKAGIFYPDLYLSGIGITVFNMLRPTGTIGELKSTFILPEVKEPKNWRQGRIPWVDKEEKILAFALIVTVGAEINTSLVKKDEMASFMDLLNPKWKNKILLNDPTTPGRGPAMFQSMDKIMGRDFLQQLVKQEPIIVRDQRQQAEWLAQGKYPIGIGSITSIIEEFKEAGAPLNFIIFKEGVAIASGASNLLALNNLPHPMSTRVFVNWFLSREGQILWTRDVPPFVSQRGDVPTDHINPLFVPKPNIKYYDQTTEEAQMEWSKYQELARQMFAPLLK